MNEYELKAYEMQAQTSFMLGYIWSRLNVIKIINPHNEYITDLLDEINPKMKKYYYPETTQADKPIAE